ncbi:MAG: M12 family metallopeptidase [Candidatus Zixiibacteriota bacterium]
MNFVTTTTRQMIVVATMISLLTCIAFAGGTPGSGERIDGVPEGCKIIEGDIIVPIDFEDQMTLGCMYNELWVNGVVPYEFDANVNSTNRTRALQAMSNWEEVSGVDFIPRTTQADYIHIQSSTGNNSFVGCIGGEQVVNIFNWTWEFIITHELGHALGLWHEQSREDRDDFVQINWGNIEAGRESNFYIHSPDSTWVGFMFGPYDFMSVMHYNDDAFSKNGLPTIDVLPPYEYFQDVIGQREMLSFVDQLTMSNLYGEASCFNGHKWDPNNDGIVLTVGDLVYMISYLSSDNPQPVPSSVTASWEYDGWANPFFSCQPTYGDALQFSLYFLSGIDQLLTVPHPVEVPSQSGLQVLFPSPITATGSGSSTVTIRLRNNTWDDMYVWMVTIPIELPIVGGSQGSISYTWSNGLSAPGTSTTVRNISTQGSVEQNCILLIRAFDGSNADPLHLTPGQSVDLIDLTASWNLNWGSVSVNYDQYTRSPACVPVTSTSLTPAGITYKDGSTVPPIIGQSIWDAVYEGTYVDGDADGNGAVDIDDVVFSIEYIFAGGQPPIPYEAGDADCSGTVDIDDVVYLIEFIFAGGSPPEDCSGGKSSPSKTVVGSAGMVVIDNTDGGNSFTLSLDADREVQAAQFEFAVSGDVSKLEARSLIDGVGVFFGETDGMFKVGLIDIYGQNMIPAGGIDIISISYEGDGKLELVNSAAVAEGGGRLETQLNRQTTGSIIPSSYALNQNYPNPFNPTTQISFSLPKDSRVTLAVYNIMGQSVATLVDDIMQAGEHNVTWHGTTDDGEPVSSGIYFYTISADDFTDARKMVLMK